MEFLTEILNFFTTTLGAALAIIVPLLSAVVAYITIKKLRSEKPGEETQVQPQQDKPELAPPVPAPRHGAVFKVFANRNPNFTGRVELLQNLREKLLSGEHTALTQAISGLGGVGKTQLALEYSYRCMDDYKIIWWMRAETPAALAGDFAALAERIGLPEKDAVDQTVARDAVIEHLEQEGNWLLVFDNAEKPEHIKKYLPKTGKGHVIITSRNPQWGGVARPLDIEVMRPEEAIEFLLKRTKREEDPDAEKLADELGYLPLALEQAGAFMAARGCSCGQYLERFEKRSLELFNREKPDNYDDTVTTTWCISFSCVEEESLAGMELLSLLAFFAPDNIPLDVIKKGVDLLPEKLAQDVNEPDQLDQDIIALRKYSLIQVQDDAISLHRLVQAVIRDRMGNNEKNTWANAAARIVSDVFPFGEIDVRTWPECARLIDHALATAGHAEEIDTALERAGYLLNQAGLFLIDRAQYEEARSVQERQVRINDKYYGPDHPETATALSNLGRVLQYLGDLAGARDHIDRALAIDENAYGKEHPNVARDLNNLGGVFLEIGDFNGARDNFKRALQIFEKELGPDHPNVAILFNNLGGVLQKLGDLAGARDHYERALEILQKAYGKEIPKMAYALNNLGGVLLALGDLAGARDYCERALVIDEKAYGKEHPEVATDLNNLGKLLYDLGDFAGAREYLERALLIRVKFLGEDHPLTVATRDNLEIVERKLREG